MPNSVAIGSDPVHKAGDALLLKYTLRDRSGAIINLDITGVTEVTWILAKKEGGMPLVTKTLSGGEVTKLDQNDSPGRVDVLLENLDTASRKGDFYHEIQIEPGPSTGAYGVFTITPSSAPP